jgi:hypothetical protein
MASIAHVMTMTETINHWTTMNLIEYLTSNSSNSGPSQTQSLSTPTSDTFTIVTEGIEAANLGKPFGFVFPETA